MVEETNLVWGTPAEYQITITYLAGYFGITENDIYSLFPVFANLHNAGSALVCFKTDINAIGSY